MILLKVGDIPLIRHILRKAEEEIMQQIGVAVTIKIEDIGESKNLNEIIRKVVCNYFKVSWNEVISTSRQEDTVKARHVYMFIMCAIYKRTRRSVAKECGNRDHSTAVTAIRKIKGYYEINDPFINEIENIKKLLP